MMIVLKHAIVVQVVPAIAQWIFNPLQLQTTMNTETMEEILKKHHLWSTLMPSYIPHVIAAMEEYSLIRAKEEAGKAWDAAARHEEQYYKFLKDGVSFKPVRWHPSKYEYLLTIK